MADPAIRPFLCDTIEKSLLRGAWEKWLRSFTIYANAEEIIDEVKKRNKLLHYGGPQLQEVAYSLPGALEEYDAEKKNKVFEILVEKLSEYFSPQQNSTFERHLFRDIKPEEGENFNKFLLKIRQQAAKCAFGSNAEEAKEINLKDKLIDCWAPLELKRKLLEKERSLKETIELCQIHEQIGNQSKIMNTEKPNPALNQINRIATGTTDKNTDRGCTRCGKAGHNGNDMTCPARKCKCNKCGFLGHFARKCKTKSIKRAAGTDTGPSEKRRKFERQVRYINEEDNTKTLDETREFECFKVTEDGQAKLDNNQDEWIECEIGGVTINMLIDSGSGVNIISGKEWEILTRNGAEMWNVHSDVNSILKPYGSGNPLEIKHGFQAIVGIQGGAEIIASFNVVEKGEVALLGKETAKQLGVLKLGVAVNKVEMMPAFPKIKNVKVKLTINPAVRPVQQPLRRIPISVEKQVEEKLNEALRNDIIERVHEPSDWISPIVVIFKGNQDIRICIDMRRANTAILRENYPIPTFDSFMTKLRNTKYFSRLDLTNAYHQLELDEESRPITTFITHKGMFRYKRLLFGVNSAPEIFQRIFEGILAPCKNCLNYLDDIIIYGSTEEEHDQCLDKVLQVLQENNVLLNKEKCVIKVQHLQFLGHTLSHNGIKADHEKVETIRNARAPATKEEVRSFLGLVTYLGKFIPDLADTTDRLRQLIKKDVKFIWDREHQKSFDKLKEALAKLPTLSYFDVRKRTRLIADASPVALGAVLLQFDKDATPRVISFASKSLSEVEKRYSQTEKESLALVWGVERFHFYLAGLDFELETDHKPLEAIFKPTSRPPARIERWVLRLQSYKFKVIYQPGKSNIADSFSRLCKPDGGESFDKDSEVHVIGMVERARPKAMRISQIISDSRRDQELADAVTKINNDNWDHNDQSKYFPFRGELTTLGPLLLRNTRIVIPEQLRVQTLQLAHEGHPGETVMKRRLRAKVWWPQIDKQAEHFVKNCRDCLLVSQPNRPIPMTRHKFPEGPWQCLAMDLMGPLPNQEQVLVIIDYYSRYQEIKFLTSATSSIIIGHLREMFCRLGIPKSIRTDNGRQFISSEFRQFCDENNIVMIQTPPYWPQANGEVENMNKSILKRLQISHANNKDYKQEVQNFTLMYNVTPHGTTGKSPAELLFGRNIRDKIPSLADIEVEYCNEEAHDRDLVNKQKGKEREDKARAAKDTEIRVGDKVLVKNVIFPHKLTPRFNNIEYEVLQKTGNEVIIVDEGGRTFKRNISHVKKIQTETNTIIADPPTMLASTTLSQPKEAEKAPLTPSLSTNPNVGSTQEPAGSPPKSPKRVKPLKLQKKEGMWRPATE